MSISNGHLNGFSKPVSEAETEKCNGGDVKKQSNGFVKQEVKTVSKKESPPMEETPLHIALICYFSYAVLIIFGHLRDFMRRTGLEKNQFAQEKDREVGLLNSFL